MQRLTLMLVLLLAPVALLLQLPPSAATPRQMLRPSALARPACFAVRCSEEGEATRDGEPLAEDGAAAEEQPNADAAEDDTKAKLKAEKRELRDAIANLEAQLIKARGEAAAAQEDAKNAGESGYMLIAADFERFRMKAKDELTTQKGFGRTAAVRSLLEFTETFGALQAERDGDEGAGAIHKYYGGIWKQYEQLLDSWKVAPFEASAGEQYDLKKHQTVEVVASDTAPKDTIIEMVERGWAMDGETVRLAKCKVSSGPAADEPDTEPAAEVPADDAAAEE